MIRPAFLFFLLFPSIAFSQHKVQFEAPPTWTESITYSTEPLDTVHSGGYYYLLLERQFNVESKESYFRTSIKVLTEKGLEMASSININFNPAFQKLIFHSVIIKRGNETINKLKNNQFEVLRREANMDRLVYNKSLDAILNLDDVRVGDIIEYSYTVKGNNPVFSNKFIKTLFFNYSDPIGKSFSKIICKTDRNLQFKKFNNAISPTRLEMGNLSFYTWDINNIPALLTEDGVPSWFDAYTNVEISEFKSWEDVSQWALPLYSTKSIPSGVIDNKIAQIKNSNKSIAEQVNACIQFVQDEIRYLSFSDGIQGYKPHSPIQVFNQRFGDCKDKSLLLSFMLQKLGVESYPALVNTSYGKELDMSLPSPILFDHCIAQFTLNDSVFWIDPTSTLQRGSLKSKTIPNYYNALVLASQTKSLSSIAFNSNVSRTKVEEDFYLNTIGGSATLKVKTSYWGREANSMRNYWKSNSSEEIKESYTNFYANDYTDIRLDKYVEFLDDEDQNILTTIENYTIENFWQYDSIKEQHAAGFYPRVLANYLELPSRKTRSMPYGVSYPVCIDQTISIHLPEAWTIRESKKLISSPAFHYSSEINYFDRNIKLRYSYKSLQDYVEANENKNHLDKIQSARDDLSFQITYGGNTEKSSGFNAPFLIIILALAPLIFLGLRKVYFFDPRSANYQMAYDQLGSWLILPAIGIYFSPFLLLLNIGKARFFNYDHWRTLTDPTYSLYNPSLGAFTLFQLTHSIILLSFSVLFVVLLAQKRTSFPMLFCFLCGTEIIHLACESLWLAYLNLPTAFEESSSSIKSFGLAIGALIWVPIFIYSDRVKGTFRERLK